MPRSLAQTLEHIRARGLDSHLRQLRRGLEKESLRVDANGSLAQTPHPAALGSTLTHPSITTDYAEPLLEFVTGVHTDIAALLNELREIHHFTYQHIGAERLWVSSMPCIVESEDNIPIARYGSSNIARMKETYRRGLSYRYGALMQTIAGIHYNFSMPDEFWPGFHQTTDPTLLRDKKSASYFALIRNFHRNSWLGAYLFGASPAVCRSFLRGREHQLDSLDAHSFYKPNATSLRLSRLGYSNETQTCIDICYNTVTDFVHSLRRAIQTSHPDYEQIGVRVDGEYRQLNSNILQIENEFYASIRPKRVAASGQSPSNALHRDGVQYVEVRSIDLDPFAAIGIDPDCVRFFDLFLLYCLFSPSPQMATAEFQQARDNLTAMVMNGRDPAQTITLNNATLLAPERMQVVLAEMAPVAALLDQVHGDNEYRTMLTKQQQKVEDPEYTPSARVLRHMRENNQSFYEFSMAAAVKSEQLFKHTPIEPAVNAMYRQLAAASDRQREALEQADEMSFEQFLADYFQRQRTEG